MQEFFINKGSVNPVLEMEVIHDGRYEYMTSLISEVLQDSVATFSMRNTETNKLKVSKAPVNIVLANDNGCVEKYILQYKWKERDLNEEGIYRGWFEIKFNGDIKQEGIEYPQGNLIVPIEDDLLIYVK